VILLYTCDYLRPSLDFNYAMLYPYFTSDTTGLAGFIE
jgi:hypothetical protein